MKTALDCWQLQRLVTPSRISWHDNIVTWHSELLHEEQYDTLIKIEKDKVGMWFLLQEVSHFSPSASCVDLLIDPDIPTAISVSPLPLPCNCTHAPACSFVTCFLFSFFFFLFFFHFTQKQSDVSPFPPHALHCIHMHSHWAICFHQQGCDVHS